MAKLNLQECKQLLNEQLYSLEQFLKYCWGAETRIQSIPGDEHTKSSIRYYFKQLIPSIERLLDYLVILKGKLTDLEE